ncbi:MAG: bifunctional homocysteine S-methyltransferase/methylenetetrahydrofolate reductase [Deltaproteobacteria bacterium]|nr:bifunctional homocysteine S-methyltransferase/methylenetetrahydrofolate reductase [Deltaproteobacteria bacterium]
MTTLPPFLETLARGPMVCDGAMGTYLYEKGVFINRSFDELCLSAPETVTSVHRDYLDAGADILETNTYGASRVALRRYGLEDKADAINRAAVTLCRKVAGTRAYVAGSMGPSYLDAEAMISDTTRGQVRDAYAAQATALCEAGADLLMFETFALVAELELALEATRHLHIPKVAQLRFEESGLARQGATPRQVAERLRAAGADVVGANCNGGPEMLLPVIEAMVGAGAPVSVQPNAGHPRVIEGRYMYLSTPEYFGVYARRFLKAGARIVGGCCGTTPAHIKRVAAAVRMMSGGRVEVRARQDVESGPIGRPETEFAGRSPFAAKLGKKFVVCVEVSPPSGLDTEKTEDAVRMLKSAGVDAINIPDGPRATVKMSNLLFAAHVQEKLGVETLTHFCCRDRNLLGLVTDALGAHFAGLRNLVVITGDPPKTGDFPDATAVFDLDSVGLLQLLNRMNRGIDPGGKEMKQQTSFVLATGAEPAALDYDREVTRLSLKKEAGAHLVMTQPVYDPEVLLKFLGDIRGLNLPVLVGILPLASSRNAEFLHREVPGMQVPDAVRERMRKAGDAEAGRREGVRMAQETLRAVQAHVQGAYIMPPLGRYRMALDVLEGL